MSDDMVEKARACAEDVCNRLWHEITSDNEISVREIADVLAEFARSAVRDAFREMDEFTIHGPDCAMYHAMNPANKICDCGLSALRKKFEVEG